MKRTRRGRVQRRRPSPGISRVNLDVSHGEYDRYAEAAREAGHDSPERWAKEVLSLRAWEILSHGKDKE